MNSLDTIKLGLVVLATVALPVALVTNFILRSRKEMTWLQKLWEDHEKITGSTADDLKRRKELRAEMRDLAGLAGHGAAVVIRQAVLAFLIMMQVGILWKLSHMSTVGTSPSPEFWILSVFLLAALLATVLLSVKRENDSP